MQKLPGPERWDGACRGEIEGVDALAVIRDGFD
jgi:hypothetical protein